jgi:hypothetical protein
MISDFTFRELPSLMAAIFVTFYAFVFENPAQFANIDIKNNAQFAK